ncbi:hypothetical protein U729_3098 (plasmid) [Clostridium baratii str. Sullivan]|uniref:Uncharacterized protein n=1 Tax=Clostridium baratii str. Sullivan TaxID=1415775 RepID=A0A0A7G035_9CLOT|nr:hypothetical protein [Clostridium baratii]AIY85218.1 hypothetical protein U729_3098 [Clostridium baratii str. Sullivan]
MSRKKLILKIIKINEIALRYMKRCNQTFKSKGFGDYMFLVEKKEKHIKRLRSIKNNYKK